MNSAVKRPRCEGGLMMLVCNSYENTEKANCLDVGCSLEKLALVVGVVVVVVCAGAAKRLASQL